MTYYTDSPELQDSNDEPLEDWLWDDDDDVAAPLALSPDQQVALGAAVEAGLLVRGGCDNTLRAAQEWARGAGVDWAGLRAELEDNGGYCDCEVLLNVLPDDDPDVDPEPD